MNTKCPKCKVELSKNYFYIKTFYGFKVPVLFDATMLNFFEFSCLNDICRWKYVEQGDE